MTEPISFASTTPNLKLPLLFQGQAQKEFFFNEAMFLLDALTFVAIEGEATTPPLDPDEGDTWLVAPNATGEWAEQDTHIAIRHGGAWVFVSPRPGVSVFNKELSQAIHYNNGWVPAASPSVPTGGTTIDSEARVAINQILEALRTTNVIA
ncbi:hypothetical protein BPTFM16_01961 [Altererythrobacter insulae]|nr:hypothetical protein BPTFM16_01961 [Altererythrobacter insulae]